MAWHGWVLAALQAGALGIGPVRTEGPDLVVQGTVSLPVGHRIEVALSLEGEVGLRAPGVIEGGTWLARLGPLEGEVYPGDYTLTVLDLDGDTVAAIQVPLGSGTPAEAEARRALVRDYLAANLEAWRAVYVAGIERLSWIRETARLRGEPDTGVLPAQAGAYLVSRWEERFQRGLWLPLAEQARLDLEDWRRRRFLSPYPRADAALVALSGLAPSWLEAASAEVRRLAGAGTTEGAGGPGEADRLTGEARALAAAVAADLELATPAGWEAGPLAAPERGRVEGRVYASPGLGFRVSAPEGWRYDFFTVDPLIRLRLRPPKGAGYAEVVVEDHPGWTRPEELAGLIEVRRQERWPGYRKLRFGPFAGGYQIEFTSDFPDLRYHVWDREWFVDRSRTVGVVCVASEDEWERLLPDLVHVVEGFDAAPD
ncbi:MAG: hypothetical protein HY722_00295 [Planctomycetes bacterium]|nr:hypothetical protein [Planctomycetota bacterium]